jgi:hypothetical protein
MRNEKYEKKGKAILVTGRRGAWDSETSRIPYFLENRFTDCREVVSLTSRSAIHYPQEDFWYSFLLRARQTLGL